MRRERDFMISFWFNSNPITSGEKILTRNRSAWEITTDNLDWRLILCRKRSPREGQKYIWTSITLMCDHLSCYILSFLHFDGFKCTKSKAEKILNYFGFILIPKRRKPSIVWLINSLSFWTLHHTISRESFRMLFICSVFFLLFSWGFICVSRIYMYEKWKSTSQRESSTCV